MTSLKHGVNLSRRACRRALALLLLSLTIADCTPIESTTKQSPSITVDGTSTYPGLGFGPMGPVGPMPGEPPGTQLRQQLESTSELPSTEKTKRTLVIAAFEFHRVETPFLIGLWIFFASIAKIGFHMAPKLSKMFPESCLLIFVGVLIGALLLSTHSVHVQPLTPDTFFLYMLPPIILDAGYFMPNRLFFDHLGTILLFAVVGTVFNTLTIGASLWACGQTGMFGCTTPLLDMFLFSALISAVDPVAVLAVFEEIHVDEVLYIVVFGESLLNDAVTVVLYHMFEAYTEMGPSNLVYTDFLAGLCSFLVVAVGGTCIGVVWGFATGLVTRFTHEVRVIEPIFIFVMAYLAYLNAEMFHMSGILAITFCGITMKNYVEGNISHKSHTTIKYTMKMLSSSSETIIFMFLGVATVNNNHVWNTWFVLLTIVFCSGFRIIGVCIFSAVANKFRLHKLNKVEKFVMSYGGLRGAVAFALVLLIDPEVVKLQPMFVTTTIAVIYFTVFIQGITIKPLVKMLNVKTAEKRKPTMNERIHERSMDPAVITSLLTAIREAVSTNRRQDDVALPVFDPATNDNGADPWCADIESLAKEFGWSGIVTVAKAGKALKGSALAWFTTWEPDGGRTWENFCSELIDLYPPKKNLSEKLTKAVLYNSDSADTYCEYAREKIRLLRNTKVGFTESQLIELICGGIRDVNVRMSSFNSHVRTTGELITLFTSYSKTKKRPFEQILPDKCDSGPSAKRPKQNEGNQDRKCFLCGKLGHFKSQCLKLQRDSKEHDNSLPTTNTPVQKKSCTICKKVGHDDSICWFKNRTLNATSGTGSTDNQPSKVNCFTKSVLKLTKVSIYETNVDCLIDTGASCSIIKESIAKQLGGHLFPCSSYLDGIGNGKLHVFATITVPVRFDDVCLELEIFVAKDQDFHYDLLVGRNAVDNPDVAIVTDSMGCKLTRKQPNPVTKSDIYIVNMSLKETIVAELASTLEHLDDDLQQKIVNIFEKHSSVLPITDSISTVTTGELKIKLKKDEVVNYRPYRLAPVEREKVNKMVNDLLQKNVIRESDSPFASPALLVKKKDGSDRLCVDYRALNKNVDKDRYPLPLIEDQIDKLGKAQYYISIDMKNGFYQIPVADDSIKYTAFVTPDGHYEFTKMPFGICNGPSVFQKAINRAVHHLKFLLVYIDDLLIPCSSIDEGLNYLEQTIEALSKAGFMINPKKCKFFVQSIEYLGRHISKDGVRPSDSKVDALINSPVPTNVKQVRQLMGLASYFRKFIPEFASRTACITKLTKNNQKWEWGPEQDAARNYIIERLVSKPLLAIYNPSLPTELHTDASALGYGAILIQKENNVSKVVAYFSKRTSPAESKYSSYDLETLAIYNALKHFRVYLLGIDFKIITDCNAIKSTENKRDLSPRVSRWWTFLQDFRFEIVYKKGKYISHVDFLSRNPVETRSPTINIINESQSWLEIAQQTDPETQTLIEQLNRGEIDSNQYVFQNNLLYYKTESNTEPKLFLPRGSRFSTLRLYHDENCHVGYDKTLSKLRENFWFPSMAAYVRKYLSHCLVCIERKAPSGPKQGFLHPIDKTALPFDTIHLDCTGPFPASDDGYKHILVAVDGFTKFCILKPLKTLNAHELIFAVRETITLFGTPSLVITDRGTNFSANQVRSFFQELQIEHQMVATGTPRGNGQAERYVHTVLNMLRTTCEEMSDWPSLLWKVQQSLNTTVQKSTGFTPVRLLIGRESNIPIIQARLANVLGDTPISNCDVQADRQVAYRRLCNVAEKFKERFDTVRRDNQMYNIGDFVFISQDHRRNDKLSPKFKGPYEIINILDFDRYVLRGTNNLRNVTVAKEKLRLWPGEWKDQTSTTNN